MQILKGITVMILAILIATLVWCACTDEAAVMIPKHVMKKLMKNHVKYRLLQGVQG